MSDVFQPTIFVCADAFVSVIRTLAQMTLHACVALLAKAKNGKRTADWCCRVRVNVRETAVCIVTVSVEEMHANWHSLRSEVMRKITTSTGSTLPSQKIGFANSSASGIVFLLAAVSFRAYS